MEQRGSRGGNMRMCVCQGRVVNVKEVKVSCTITGCVNYENQEVADKFIHNKRNVKFK